MRRGSAGYRQCARNACTASDPTSPNERSFGDAEPPRPPDSTTPSGLNGTPAEQRASGRPAAKPPVRRTSLGLSGRAGPKLKNGRRRFVDETSPRLPPGTLRDGVGHHTLAVATADDPVSGVGGGVTDDASVSLDGSPSVLATGDGCGPATTVAWSGRVSGRSTVCRPSTSICGPRRATVTLSEDRGDTPRIVGVASPPSSGGCSDDSVRGERDVPRPFRWRRRLGGRRTAWPTFAGRSPSPGRRCRRRGSPRARGGTRSRRRPWSVVRRR